MSENSPVRHRIDGLEIAHKTLGYMVDVRHRIDGLETASPLNITTPSVRHRIDGLEKKPMSKTG